MRVLIVTETYLPTISGVANSTHSIAKFLVSAGHAVTVVAPSPIMEGKIEEVPGISVLRTPAVSDPLFAGKSMTLFPLGVPVLFNAMKTGKFDVVHIQEPGSLGISALFLAKFFHIPTVGALHTMPQQFASVFGPLYGAGFSFIHWFDRTVYRHFDAIMTPTETAAQFLRSLGIRRPVYAISNGIDIRRYSPQKHKPHAGVVFGYLGRIDRDKHLDIAVRALAKTDAGVRLVIAGFGRERAALEQLVANLGISEKITFIGLLNEQKIIALYHRLDAFVIPSPVESQSIVTLQAMACGLPVVAADAGALPELVHDGENGFLFPPDDVASLAQKMNTLAESRPMRARFGRASRRISRMHDKPRVLAKLEKLYRKLL